LSLPYSAKSRPYVIEVELLVRDEDRYYVDTLYVDELLGNNGDMARDQLKAHFLRLSRVVGDYVQIAGGLQKTHDLADSAGRSS